MAAKQRLMTTTPTQIGLPNTFSGTNNVGKRYNPVRTTSTNRQGNYIRKETFYTASINVLIFNSTCIRGYACWAGSGSGSTNWGTCWAGSGSGSTNWGTCGGTCGG